MDYRAYGQTLIFEEEYNEFKKFIETLEDGVAITEGILDGLTKKLKDKVHFVKKLAYTAGIDFKEFAKKVLNKTIYKFFSKIKWSLKVLSDKIKAGLKIFKDVKAAIKQYVENNKVVKWTDEKLQELDKFLKTHPKTRRLAGVLVGAMMIYIWWSLISFTGDVDYDFNMDGVLQAFEGKYSLSDLFGGSDGVKLITLIMTNTLGGLTFPYAGATKTLFVIGLVYTLLDRKLTLSEWKKKGTEATKNAWANTWK